jgi:hypothetical protein
MDRAASQMVLLACHGPNHDGAFAQLSRRLGTVAATHLDAHYETVLSIFAMHEKLARLDAGSAKMHP